MAKPKIDDATANEDFEQGLDKPAGLPVVTDDNEEPNADSRGDSDDEQPDENEAVPEHADED